MDFMVKKTGLQLGKLGTHKFTTPKIIISHFGRHKITKHHIISQNTNYSLRDFKKTRGISQVTQSA